MWSWWFGKGCSRYPNPWRAGWEPVTLCCVTSAGVVSLASYRRCCEHLTAAWPAFRARREERLAQQRRFGTAAEKVAENILEDLFTMVLDWPLADVNNQVGYADLVLTRLGIKHLIVEVKRPGALAWNERSVDLALAQARRYADEQKVGSIAVSDGIMLYACDHIPGGNRDRAFVRLDQATAPQDLWWLSPDGIYRPRKDSDGRRLRLLPPAPEGGPGTGCPAQEDLVHPKYRLPARCFAYAGSAADPKSWHLPYLRADGTPDLARLPKAIQAILSNYRGLPRRPRQQHPGDRHTRGPGHPGPHRAQRRQAPRHQPRGSRRLHPAAGSPGTTRPSRRRDAALNSAAQPMSPASANARDPRHQHDPHPFDAVRLLPLPGDAGVGRVLSWWRGLGQTCRGAQSYSGSMTGDELLPGDGKAPPPGELRASYQDRDRVAELLRTAAGDGRLTAEELDQRLEAALTARTYGELAALTRDLPPAAGLALGAAVPAPKDMIRLDSHSSSLKRDGHWLVPRRMEVGVTSGSVTLDFTEAVLAQTLLQIDADVRSGSLTLVTKPGVVVDTDEVAVRSGTVKVRAPWSSEIPVVLRIQVSGKVGSGSIVARPPRRTFWQWLRRRPRPYAPRTFQSMSRSGSAARVDTFGVRDPPGLASGRGQLQASLDDRRLRT